MTELQIAPPLEAGAPLRVMVVVSALSYGGAETQVVELANSADPAQLDLQVCSLSSYVPQAERLRHPERLHIVRKRWRFDATVVPRLARLLRAQRTEVVHGYLFDAEIAAALAGRLAGVRAVVGSERNASYKIRPINRLAYRLTRGCFDGIVANSYAGAAFSQRALGFPASHYRVVRNGVDTTRFRPVDGAPTRAALGLTAAMPVVGMFASLKPQKNHPLLLQAARAVLAAVPEARFLFVGDILAGGKHGSSDYAREVQLMVDSLGLRAACQFLGNRTDLPQLYSACDLTVLPSLFEGTPNAVLESLACGCPVVVTDVADNALIVPDRQVGRVVPSGDHEALSRAIVELLTVPGYRASLAANARAWAEGEFSLRALSANMTKVYRELAAR
jgi:glycosyltransferase involved in cell wall biosynthesis